MEDWSVHHLFQEAEEQLDRATALDLQRYASRLRNDGLPVIFTLRHLAKITGVRYTDLHESVNRRRELSNYRMFAIKKRSGGRRFIHAVSENLATVHRYVNTYILQKTRPHPCSYAFHSSGGIRECAAQHCGARWLLKFDLTDFFYYVTEPRVFRVFQLLGYKDLLAFELSRLCTTLRVPDQFAGYRTRTRFVDGDFPYSPSFKGLGVAPQGASTSPMLSNLVARELDEVLSGFADEKCLVYTRYVDDLTFSATDLPKGLSVAHFRDHVVRLIRKSGFNENPKKFHVAGPGARRIVLGLLVDGDVPRISKDTYKRIDRLLYATGKFGLEATAAHEKFDSAYGFYNHLGGLVAYVKDVDQARSLEFSELFSRIEQPIGVTGDVGYFAEPEGFG